MKKIPNDILQILTKAVLEDDVEVRKQFVSHFSNEIEAFLSSLKNAYIKWLKYDSLIERNLRKAYVSVLLFNAINTLSSSLKLFLWGYEVPSGNLLRHTLESVCLAILCSNEHLPYYHKMAEDKFSAKSAVNCLARNSKKLNINQDAVKVLKQWYNFYHNYSHATLLSLTQNISFSKRRSSYIGPSFDGGKLIGYKKEVEIRVSLANVFNNVIDGILMTEEEHS